MQLHASAPVLSACICSHLVKLPHLKEPNQLLLTSACCGAMEAQTQTHWITDTEENVITWRFWTKFCKQFFKLRFNSNPQILWTSQIMISTVSGSQTESKDMCLSCLRAQILLSCHFRAELMCPDDELNCSGARVKISFYHAPPSVMFRREEVEVVILAEE